MAVYFEGYGKLVLDDEFIWGTDAYIETFYGRVNFKNLEKYSALFIGERTAEPLTEEEDKALEKWVSEGGALILFFNDIRKMWGNKPPPWVAGDGASAAWGKGAKYYALRDLNHPLVKGLAGLGDSDGPLGAKTAWEGEAALYGFSEGDNLIGLEDQSTLFVKAHGKGKVIILNTDFIPAAPMVQDGQPTLNLKPVVRQFWTNLVEYLHIPTRTQVIADWAKASGRKEPLLVWYQEGVGEKPLGGITHNPPYPAPADELKEMRFDMGIGERLRRDFFVTTLQEFSELTVQPTDLADDKGNKIPADRMHISIQAPPRPDYPKASYYIVDPKHVPPMGVPGVKAKRDDTLTYWIDIGTDDITPGEYKGALNFTNEGKSLASVPMLVKVWPLHAPDRDVMHFEMEHIWFSMPGGYWLDPKQDNPALLAKYQQALGKLQVDVAETWGDLGYYEKFVTLRGDGRPLAQAIAETPEIFLQDPMPSLSFSGFHDIWWNNAIHAGMTCFSQTWALGPVSAEAAIKDRKLEVGSPEQLRFVKWYWGEYYKYLRERGLYKAYIKIGDEGGPDVIPEYIRTAAPMQAAGFKTYTTAYNMIQDKASVEKMNPYTDMWQLASPLDNPRDVFRENKVSFDPTDEIWLTAASSWWGSFYSFGRGYGMMAAWLRMNGVHLHGYMRWHNNESEGALAGPDGPLDTVGVTNWGQSISEGRYLAQLYRLIALAKKTNKGVNVAKQIEAEINAKLIGLRKPNQPEPLIPLRSEGETKLAGISTINVVPDGVSQAAGNASKLMVFDMMLRMKKAMGDVPVNVHYDKFPLVNEGKPASVIVSGSDEKAADLLVGHVKKLSGVQVPVVAQADWSAQKEKGTFVLLGTLKSNPTLASFAQKELSTEITPFYPPAGSYAIYRVEATKSHPDMLIVAGGDAAGLEIGVKNLGRLLGVENRW